MMAESAWSEWLGMAAACFNGWMDGGGNMCLQCVVGLDLIANEKIVSVLTRGRGTGRVCMGADMDVSLTAVDKCLPDL